MRTPGWTAAKSAAGCILALLLALGSSACGADSRPPVTSPSAGTPSTASGSGPNPCTLVTAEELATAVGKARGRAVTVTLTESGEEQQGLRCEWTYPNKDALTDAATIRITAWRGRQFYTPALRPEGFRPVSGIGDEAHASEAVFMFRRGEDVLRIHVSGDSANARIEPAIARLLASKLV
jgi:hypothetical protein